MSVRAYEIIEPGDPFAETIGFTKDYFDGYVCRVDKEIYISLIVSRHPGRGNLTKLFSTIWDQGFTVKVPTPMGVMPNILDHMGFQQTMEDGPEEEGGAAEVWVKQPPNEMAKS